MSEDATSPKCVVTNFTVAHVILCWKTYGRTMGLNQPPFIRIALNNIPNKFFTFFFIQKQTDLGAEIKSRSGSNGKGSIYYQIKNLFEGIHSGSLGDMDAVVLIRLGLAPTIENHHSNGLTLWKLRVIRQFPRKS